MPEPERKIVHTEDPNGSVITEDCGEDGEKKVRLWSKDFEYQGRWCFECKCWHAPVGSSLQEKPK